ncbi:hypothetical protein AgCh_000403 [Apium graveolens]
MKPNSTRIITTFLGYKAVEFNLESDKEYLIRLDQEIRKAKINDLRAAIFQTGEDTAELINAKMRMGELQRQVSVGSWTPQGHDDLLSRALGHKEHGGCVRGVGGGAKIKEVFGSGKSKQSRVLSVDELATITKEITKKVQKECDEKMNEMMNLKLEGIFNHLKQVGLSIPEDNLFNDIGIPKNETVRSSCQSVNRQDHILNIKGENMIHNNSIAPNNVRVSVDDVVPEFQLILLPVPCNELETIENAAGNFVQWPKDLVTLGQDSISMDKEKGHDISPKKVVMMPKKVESKGSERNIRLTRHARTAFKLYEPGGGKRNNRKEFLWIHTEVECPQQEGGTECGFFVMKNMHDIVMLCQKDLNTNWKVGLGSRRSTKKEINEIRELWEIFLLSNVYNQAIYGVVNNSKDNKDDDEQKHDEQKPSGSNLSQS